MTTETALYWHAVGGRAGHRAGAAAWLVLGLVAGNATFNRIIPVPACTDMTRPQEISSVVMPVVLRFGGAPIPIPCGREPGGRANTMTE